jgi:uncharacterized protein
MRGNTFIVDATVHAFNFKPENYLAEFVPDMVQMLYQGAHIGFHPRDTTRFNLDWDEFLGMFDYYPELLWDVLFGESQTDVACYHGVPMDGIFKDGSSPIWVAHELRKRFPARMHIYGPLYPWMDDATDRLEQMVKDYQICGIKFYPVDLYKGQLKASRLDSEGAFRCVERARNLGLKMIAVHKAVPLGPLPLEPFASMYDMQSVIEAFPDMVFEIVHGGAAFLEQTVELLRNHKNVVVNLEALPGFIHHPQLLSQWNKLMTAFIECSAADRIFYSSGAMGTHPQAAIDAFANFQLPAGSVQITAEQRSAMFGANFARFHGWNIEALKVNLQKDAFGLERDLKKPWHSYRERRHAKTAIAR